MGEEKVRIDRPGSNPVWCLQWNLNRYLVFNNQSN